MDFYYSQLFVRPEYPTRSFAGETVIVTGANVGLGLEAARHFVRLGAAKVILAVRNLPAGEQAKESIEASTKRPGTCEVWHLDLSSFDSVKRFAERAQGLERLDALVENAAIGTSKFELAEGYERTITVNVISTALLALLLVPKLKASAQEFGTTPRLSIVSSGAHRVTTLPELQSPDGVLSTLSDPSKAVMTRRYSNSKLLEVLFVRALAPKLSRSSPNIILNILNPGFCHSQLARERDG